jgi:hypothetical protein
MTLTEKNTLLLVGGYFSLAFAVFQISGVFWPPNVIKYFGGPAELSQTHPVIYALLCLGVALMVAVFGIYALSGAGKIRTLPWLRTVITVTTAIYLLRGLMLVPQIPVVTKHPQLMRFALFSVIALCVGLVHLIGLTRLFKQGHPGEALSKS